MTGRGRGDRGQAVVELALVLPLLATMAMVLLQVSLVVRDQVVVTHAAREGARQAAVADDPDAVRRVVLASARLDDNRVDIEIGPRPAVGGQIRVRVRYRSPTELPLVGGLVGDVEVESTAVMRVER